MVAFTTLMDCGSIDKVGAPPREPGGRSYTTSIAPGVDELT
jgi:hypothetical protein